MGKTKLSRNYAATFTSLILIAALPLMFAACSKKMHFSKSIVVPAAEGAIKWKKDNNSNYLISMNILRLAEPDRLQPPKKVYVAWMETKANGIKNIGQLKTSTGLFSKTLIASLKTVTPFEPVSFSITAEQDGATSYPGGQVVLRAEN